MIASASLALPPLPQFAVALTPPDLSPWTPGNTGIEGFTTRDSGSPGPHLVLVSLMHGNELAGAIALDRLLRADLRPARGKLTFGFANLAAFRRFDAAEPVASRYVEEDLNRVWDPAWLEGGRRSLEIDRAREMRPLIDTADALLDLHSMLWPSIPLILCGPTTRGRQLAQAVGTPGLVVSDAGHANGRRLIDYAPFSNPHTAQRAILVEAGQHWEEPTVAATLRAIGGMMRTLGMAAKNEPRLPPVTEDAPSLAEVTAVITASTGSFTFTRPFRGGDLIPRRDTLLALDGGIEIRTPYDDCLLIMPSLRPSRGHTAVRLARRMG
jgi:predicted deacylase